MTFARRDIAYVGLIILLWVAAIILVDPRGNFPTVDDWAYLQSVKSLRESGDLRFSDWTATNLLTNIAWGALFGTNYELLRASTLVAALLGGLIFYRLMRTIDASPDVSLLSSLVLLFNPLAYALSFSFMTDVPYTTMHIGAMWLIVSGLLAASRRRVLAGWAIGAAALLSRQVAMSLPMGLGGESLLRRHPAWRRALAAAMATLVYLVVQAAYSHWLRSSGRAPALYGRQMNGIGSRLFTEPLVVAKSAAKTAVHSLLYIGLFLTPITVLAFGQVITRSDGRALKIAITPAAIVTLVLFAYVSHKAVPFPTWINTLQPYGLTNDMPSVSAPYSVLLAVAGAAAIGAGLLSVVLGYVALRAIRSSAPAFDAGTFGLVTGLSLLAAIVPVVDKFDRYFIPVIPCFLLAAGAGTRTYKPRGLDKAVAAAAIAIMAGSSILATHDLMEAKRIKWAAYQQLIHKVPNRLIDAGWVFNGPTNYGKFGPHDTTLNWFERDDYRIDTLPNPDPRYTTIATYPVDRWLPWARGQAPVIVQRRLP